MKLTKELTLDCYVDADFAGLWNVEHCDDPVCVKSRTGYLFKLANCPLLWVSKLQTEIALSTRDAEFIALSQAMRELLPMRELLTDIAKEMQLDIGSPAMVRSKVFEDNNGALSLAMVPRLTTRNKHLAVKFFFFTSKIGADKGILIEKITTEDQQADCFTKGLTADLFERHRYLIMGWKR